MKLPKAHSLTYIEILTKAEIGGAGLRGHIRDRDSRYQAQYQRSHQAPYISVSLYRIAPDFLHSCEI